MSSVLHAPRLTVPLRPEDHVLGSPAAQVELVEYGDYQCPYCKRAHGEVAQVLEALGDDGFRFAFRHFPLTQVHPFAGVAAEAAEAAGAQGRFWEMHDALFELSPHLEPENLVRVAAALELDVERFARELEDHVHAPRVREDFMSGVRSGVNGTPTFFIDGVRYNGDWTAPNLLAAIREAAD